VLELPVSRETACELIAEELIQAEEDVAYFASNVKTLDRDKHGSWLRDFPIQKTYVQRLLGLAIKHSRFAIYKSRQMVVTWAMLLVCLHELLFKPGSIIAVISMTEKDAGKLLDRIKIMYDSLPAHWKIALPAIRPYKGKGGIIIRLVATFPGDLPQASIEACATNGNPGRGQTLSLCYWDEIGEQKDDECRHMYSALRPTLEGGGRLLMSSTPPRHAEHFWNQFCEGRYFGDAEAA
jgi:hypothetical protein